MEVLMRKATSTILFLLIALTIGTITASAQRGLRVSADIPFDFSVGKEEFKAGTYDLSIVNTAPGFFAVSLLDNGKAIYRTTAVRSGDVTRDKSLLVFNIVDGERYLDKVMTPDIGYSVYKQYNNKTIARAKQDSVVEASNSPK